MDDNLGNKAVPVWVIAELLDKEDLSLPSFQRDAVWDEERVELLWDSLLRGIPIGNLILASSNLPQKACQGSRYDKGMLLAETSTPQEKFSSKLVLIDGQQRAVAIRQGISDWKEGQTFRLWVDVDSPTEGQRRKEHTITHAFFLCTPGFPWGTGVSDNQRRLFRDKLERTHPDEIKEGCRIKPDYRLSLSHTRPAKAKLPIPFAAIARWFIPVNVAVSLAENSWPKSNPLSDSDIKHRMTDLIEGKDGCIVAADLREQWESHRDKIEKWVTEKQYAICQALNRKIFFELAFEGVQNLPKPEDLGEAFNRINRLGMRLDGADLFFSALKLQWNKAHDLVWKVYNDEQAGKVLTPPQIVHAAVRLVISDYNRRAQEKEKIDDRPDLSLADARTVLDGKSSIRPNIEQLIKSGNLLDLFCRLRRLLQYRGRTNGSSVEVPRKEGDDFGISLPLLARLGERKPHIYHNLLLWLHRHSDSNVADESLRRRMVRYALVDHLFLRVNINYRRRSFREVEEASINFPDARLIELAADQDLNLLIHAFKSKEGESQLLATPSKFSDEMKDKEDPVDLTDMLLWAQRRYLHDCFPDFDPTLFYNVAALPWDKDHIWPQSRMDKRSVKINEAVLEEVSRHKNRYLHSVGNLCLLDKIENRGFGNKLPGEKYDKKQLKQFAFNKEIHDKFCLLNLDDNTITSTFLEPLRQVVEARRAWLYRELYETLCLKDICRPSGDSVPSRRVELE